ncbi:General transcription factor 2-related zinc finger protein [Arabidopsis thaliana]|uniref:General transcription factor 2-related zinc finger protein n=1 Tax=Arabidopsis thaliana TaxID=3702 RepID=F4J5F9_ARATH|nr:General transcription factor 2-related zinc finger protein [Arabidopsis thaliana]AEE77626.1 General transcription factor 2-related zinc finger protein [Arabidopsis thaliana]|eukprot:NP_001154654.1 General transcription factor 2-related zinc finger protein [Arabidopsis thaliana]
MADYGRSDHTAKWGQSRSQGRIGLYRLKGEAHEGLPFCGHDETEESVNKGNFLELLKYTDDQDEVRKLQEFRVDGWNSLMIKISSFCEKHDIEKLNMDEDFVDSRKQRKKTGITNMHHYKIYSFKSLTIVLMRLLKLILILHVATATVERCFSAMKIVKTDRRNRIGD